MSNNKNKKIKLINDLNIIKDNDNINVEKMDKQYLFTNLNLIIVNNVYYYFDKNDILKITLGKNYLKFKLLICNSSKDILFEIKYQDLDVDNLCLQLEEGD